MKKVFVIYINKKLNPHNYDFLIKVIGKLYQYKEMNDEVIFIVSEETDTSKIFNSIAQHAVGKLYQVLILNATRMAGIGNDAIYDWINKMIPNYFIEDPDLKGL